MLEDKSGGCRSVHLRQDTNFKRRRLLLGGKLSLNIPKILMVVSINFSIRIVGLKQDLVEKEAVLVIVLLQDYCFKCKVHRRIQGKPPFAGKFELIILVGNYCGKQYHIYYPVVNRFCGV